MYFALQSYKSSKYNFIDQTLIWIIISIWIFGAYNADVIGWWWCIEGRLISFIFVNSNLNQKFSLSFGILIFLHLELFEMIACRKHKGTKPLMSWQKVIPQCLIYKKHIIYSSTQIKFYIQTRTFNFSATF